MSLSEAAIYSKLTEVLRDVFDDDEVEASPGLTADQVDGWDSLSHVRLLVTLKKTFEVNFSAAEAAAFKNVGDLATAIYQKRN